MTPRSATPPTRAHARSAGGWKSSVETRPSPVRDGMLRLHNAAASRRSCRIGKRQPGAGRMHDERASVTHPDFNEAAWIERLAAALEQVAAEGRPSYYPPPTELIAADRNLGRQFRIGHSFVVPTPGEPIAVPEEWFTQVVETEIAPLLREYWFDEPDKADEAKSQLLSGL